MNSDHDQKHAQKPVQDQRGNPGGQGKREIPLVQRPRQHRADRVDRAQARAESRSAEGPVNIGEGQRQRRHKQEKDRSIGHDRGRGGPPRDRRPRHPDRAIQERSY